MKSHLKFDALALQEEVKKELPVFLHLGGQGTLNWHNNSDCAYCLRSNHKIRLTGDVLNLIQRYYRHHSRRRNCACNPCKADRLAGCAVPFKCLEEAVTILNCIHEKWDPRRPVNQRLPDLTEEEKKANLEALEKNDPIVFDPRIQPRSRVDGFRIFEKATEGTPAHQLELLDDAEPASEEIRGTVVWRRRREERPDPSRF
ncbi:hypothetical protein B0H13DRAFT_2430136 [Mycena leptocephala]|nr:hypothetical protein B0H13DRAFT_2430136 [Mycena leptocephala]